MFGTRRTGHCVRIGTISETKSFRWTFLQMGNIFLVKSLTLETMIRNIGILRFSALNRFKSQTQSLLFDKRPAQRENYAIA